jgi:hypothetical protein
MQHKRYALLLDEDSHQEESHQKTAQYCLVIIHENILGGPGAKSGRGRDGGGTYGHYAGINFLLSTPDLWGAEKPQ